MAAAQRLPRFLLPKTSWTNPPRAPIRSLVPNSLPQSTRPFHIRPISTDVAKSITNYQSSLRRKDERRRDTHGSFYHTRPFTTTPSRHRDHHFDTLKFVQRLRDEGFSEEQSKAMMLVLSDVIEESIQNLTRTMVPKEGLFHPIPSHLISSIPPSIVPQRPLTPCSQKPTARPTPKKWTSPNCAPSSSRKTRPTPP